jgi:hypothetical protein
MKPPRSRLLKNNLEEKVNPLIRKAHTLIRFMLVACVAFAQGASNPSLSLAQQSEFPGFVLELLDKGDLTTDSRDVFVRSKNLFFSVYPELKRVEVKTGDQVNVNAEGRGLITFADYLSLRVFRSTQLSVSSYGVPSPNTPPIRRFLIENGGVWANVTLESQARTKVQHVVATPNVEVEPTFTKYFVYTRKVNDVPTTYVLVAEGAITVSLRSDPAAAPVVLRAGTDQAQALIVGNEWPPRMEPPTWLPNIDVQAGTFLLPERGLLASQFNLINVRAWADVQENQCYESFGLNGTFEAFGTGAITYRWETNTGATGPVESVAFDGDASGGISRTVPLAAKALGVGWVRLMVLSRSYPSTGVGRWVTETIRMASNPVWYRARFKKDCVTVITPPHADNSPTRTRDQNRNIAGTGGPRRSTCVYSAPQLIEPGDGAAFQAGSGPIFRWTAGTTGTLCPNDYYVLTIEHSQGVDETWTKDTCSHAPRYMDRLGGSKWTVVIRERTGTKANGGWDGPALAAATEVRGFTWSPSPIVSPLQSPLSGDAPPRPPCP